LPLTPLKDEKASVKAKANALKRAFYIFPNHGIMRQRSPDESMEICPFIAKGYLMDLERYLGFIKELG